MQIKDFQQNVIVLFFNSNQLFANKGLFLHSFQKNRNSLLINEL